MIRRYSLKRSDNYPFTGEQSVLLAENGLVKVTTGYPVTSAIVSHSKSVPSSAMRVISQNIDEHDFEAAGSSHPLEVLFSRNSPVIVHSLGMDFSRGSTLRQYVLSATLDGNLTTLASVSGSTDRHIMVDGPFVLRAGDVIRLFADIDESLKSSSSSLSTEILTSSASSQTSLSSASSVSSVSSASSATSGSSLSSATSLTSETSISTATSLSSNSYTSGSSATSLSSKTLTSESSQSSLGISSSTISRSSLSSATSLTSVSSVSSSELLPSSQSSASTISSVSSLSSISSVSSQSSNSSSSSSKSSSHNSSSSSSSSLNSSASSASPQTSSSSPSNSSASSSSVSSITSLSSLSSSSKSSSSSTGNLRVWAWIKYSPCTLSDMAMSSSSEWDEAGVVSIGVSAFLDDGFTVLVSGITEPTYVNFSYMAI